VTASPNAAALCSDGLQVEAELSSLQQQQRVSQLETKTLQAGIRSRQGRLKAHTRQLAALQG
jgi:hypothetical protein